MRHAPFPHPDRRQLLAPAGHLPSRRGVIVVAVAMSLLIVMAGMALVLDRAWVSTAHVELSRTAEAAALAGAGELVDDDNLRSIPDPGQRVEAVERAAIRAARENFVAGEPVSLQTGPDGDVRLGKLVPSESRGHVMFLETPHRATTVIVTAHRDRSRANPVAMMWSGAMGHSVADVVARAEATADSHVVGIRPGEMLPVPALPIAILSHDPAQLRTDTWQYLVTQRRGKDEYCYEPRTGKVTRGGDGIPEITLTLNLNQPTAGSVQSSTGQSSTGQSSTGQSSTSQTSTEMLPNARLISVGGKSHWRRVGRQFTGGWTCEDFKPVGEEMIVTPRRPVTLSSQPTLGELDWQAMQKLMGQCRICLIYVEEPIAGSRGTTWGTPVSYPPVTERRLSANSSTKDSSATTSPSPADPTRARCIGFVAGRILKLNRGPQGTFSILFQPGTLSTRTAVLARELDPQHPALGLRDPRNPSAPVVPANPYIYKISLTH